MISKQNEILIGGGGYVPPLSKVVEFQPEGILCQSGNFTLPKWKYDSDEQDLSW